MVYTSSVSYYGAEDGDARRAVVTFVWIVFADAMLKFFARCASCVDPLHLDAAELARIYSVDAATCGPDAIFSSPVALNLVPRDGALFGLGSGAFVGSAGQLLALGMLALAAIGSVLLMRWQWRAHGDPRIIGALLAGAWIEAFPRLAGDGRGLTQLDVFGLGLNLADFAFVLGAIWILTRAWGEWRA